jgi:PTS system mannose-specific IIA component
MISVLVLTHGQLAEELLDAARQIDPQLGEDAVALPLPWDIDSDDACKLLKGQLKEIDHGEGVLILTDMFGGTATNLALSFLMPGKIEVVTGTNLPMLVKLGSLRGQEMELGDMAVRLTQAGQKSIRVASELLSHSVLS